MSDLSEMLARFEAKYTDVPTDGIEHDFLEVLSEYEQEFDLASVAVGAVALAQLHATLIKAQVRQHRRKYKAAYDNVLQWSELAVCAMLRAVEKQKGESSDAQG